MSQTKPFNRLQGLWYATIVLIVLLVWTFSATLIELYTDSLWFKSLGYSQVFNTRILVSVGLAIVAILVAAAFLVFNWSLLPYRIAPKDVFKSRIAFRGRAAGPGGAIPAQEVTYSTRPLRRLFTLVAIVVGILFGMSFSTLWQTYLLASASAPFNLADPIFGQDVSFYVFKLPWYEALLVRAQILLFLGLGGALMRYLVFNQIQIRQATTHLSLLGALWLILIGLSRLLSRYALLQSDHVGVVFGAGHTDINATMVLYIAEALFFFFAAAALVYHAFAPHWKALLFVGLFWGVLTLVSAGYPAAIQKFTVEPNEFAVEKPYIEHNIRYTRYAYGLEDIDEQPYPADGVITLDDLETHRDILQNVRLWDYRPLLRTYSQLQEIRLYYTFNGVDIDRYPLNGELRQVVLSARELNVEELAEQARTWVNQHLVFTHGYGLTLSPVGEVTTEGQPVLTVRDLPPTSTHAALTITRPELYFGESTHQYVVVNTAEDEFDYPLGDTNAYSRYTGPDGVALGGLLRRALLALRFSSSQLLLSPALDRDSRILFRRTIQERAQAIAPMLWLDSDPYPVIVDGEIVWLLDAYTWTDHFPYSEPMDVQGFTEINYIRNSVKITVDAYTGAITFYLVDPNDPIAAAYAAIFPNLFRPADAAPQGIREHWRYPEDLFLVQSQLYATYHMRDPQVFYNREDQWDVPLETGQRVMEPYYMTLRLPDSEQAEFLLIRPYVPKQKQNMVAWLYADCDGDDYGRLGAFKLTKERLIYGPQQIEARIDQNPLISQQLSLWDQHGSQVLRGNLLVLPLNGTFLYVEPLYLESESGQLPELKRVLAAYGENVAMAPTLTEALRAVLSPAASSEAAPPTTEIPTDLKSLAEQALEHYTAGQSCLARNDWTCYGQEQAALEAILRAMVRGE